MVRVSISSSTKVWTLSVQNDMNLKMIFVRSHKASLCMCSKRNSTANHTIPFKRVYGVLQGPESSTYRYLARVDRKHRKEVDVWKYMSIVCDDYLTLDLILPDRPTCLNLLVGIGSVMLNKTLQFTNRGLYGVMMTRMKINKIARLRHLSPQ